MPNPSPVDSWLSPAPPADQIDFVRRVLRGGGPPPDSGVTPREALYWLADRCLPTEYSARVAAINEFYRSIWGPPYVWPTWVLDEDVRQRMLPRPAPAPPFLLSPAQRVTRDLPDRIRIPIEIAGSDSFSPYGPITLYVDVPPYVVFDAVRFYECVFMQAVDNKALGAVIFPGGGVDPHGIVEELRSRAVDFALGQANPSDVLMQPGPALVHPNCKTSLVPKAPAPAPAPDPPAGRFARLDLSD